MANARRKCTELVYKELCRVAGQVQLKVKDRIEKPMRRHKGNAMGEYKMIRLGLE
jgi:hypothetical protein